MRSDRDRDVGKTVKNGFFYSLKLLGHCKLQFGFRLQFGFSFVEVKDSDWANHDRIQLTTETCAKTRIRSIGQNLKYAAIRL